MKLKIHKICIALVVPRGRILCLITQYLLFAGTSVQSPHVVGKTCLDLLLISYNNILKKKDGHVQGKLTSFYFLEKDRKSRKENSMEFFRVK